MTPKLRTHCATTLAALVLALPVATYSYADGPLPHSAETRGDGEGRGPDGREDRHDGAGRYGGDERGERGQYGGEGRGESRRYGQSTHGEERGRSRAPRGGADDTGPDRRAPGAGSPAHGAPPRRADGGAAPESGTGRHRDRSPADPGRSGVTHAPHGKAAAERPDPSPTASLAGRQAGEGRLRPGRTSAPSPGASTPPGRPHDAHDGHDDGLEDGRDPEEAATEEHTTPHDENEAEEESHAVPDSSSPTEPAPTDDASPAAAGRSHPHPVSQPLERQMPTLTLGAGFALMGLGLGYMGLRLRRG